MANKKTQFVFVIPSYIESINNLVNLIEDSKLKKLFTVKHQLKVSLGEQLLFELLTTSSHAPAYAALSAIGNQLSGDVGHWLSLDPIELLVDGGHICLLGRDHLALKSSETQQFIGSLNQFLQQDQLRIVAGDACEWYMQFEHRPDIQSFSLSQVINRDIRAYLPFDAKKAWQKLQTELQMILFDHPLNNQRLINHHSPLNSVWPWGEGELKTYPLRAYTGIWTDSSLVKGMLALSQHNIAVHQDLFTSLPSLEVGNYLMTLNHYKRDLKQIVALLTQLFEGLMERKIHQLTLYLGNGNGYYWKAPRFKFF